MSNDNETTTTSATIGRPPKGEQTRSARMSARVEPWVLEALDNDAAPGETRADVLARWVGERIA
jgi:hypothetical protein